jgi:hypothetical protein
MLSQEPLFFIVEEAAVVAHDAVFRVAVVYRVDQALQVLPEIVLVRVAALSPTEFMGLPAKRLDRVPTVKISFSLVCWQKPPGLCVKEKQAAVDQLDGALEYLGPLFFCVFLSALLGVENEPVADVLEHFIYLGEERLFDFLCENPFGFLPEKV